MATNRLRMNNVERAIVESMAQVLRSGGLHPWVRTFSLTSMVLELKRCSGVSFRARDVAHMLDRMGVTGEGTRARRSKKALRSRVRRWLREAQRQDEEARANPPKVRPEVRQEMLARLQREGSDKPR